VSDAATQSIGATMAGRAAVSRNFLLDAYLVVALVSVTLWRLAPPIDLRWPEYITTARGEEWWLPTPNPVAGRLL
jgi:hypothetical protein